MIKKYNDTTENIELYLRCNHIHNCYQSIIPFIIFSSIISIPINQVFSNLKNIDGKQS